MQRDRLAVSVSSILLIIFGSAFILEGIFLKTIGISRILAIGVGVFQLVIGAVFAYILYCRKAPPTNLKGN